LGEEEFSPSTRFDLLSQSFKTTYKIFSKNTHFSSFLTFDLKPL